MEYHCYSSHGSFGSLRSPLGYAYFCLWRPKQDGQRLRSVVALGLALPSVFLQKGLDLYLNDPSRMGYVTSRNYLIMILLEPLHARIVTTILSKILYKDKFLKIKLKSCTRKYYKLIWQFWNKNISCEYYSLSYRFLGSYACTLRNKEVLYI